MAERSTIEWTNSTWNPVTGCDKVSPGCAHCYAETFAERWRGTPGHPFEQGFGLKLWPDRLDKPLRWRKPRMVFVNSMSDLFHEDIPDEFIAQVFAVMALADRHVFQVLTKRPERMRELLAEEKFELSVALHVDRLLGHPRRHPIAWPLPNAWLGVSIENRRFVHRADVLRETPAAVRFISAEPLLGPLVIDASQNWDGSRWSWPDLYDGAELDLRGIDWLIAGGESGPGHRRIDEQWVRDLRDACQATRIGDERPDTAFFFKQWGGLRRSPVAGCWTGASGQRCLRRGRRRKPMPSRPLPAGCQRIDGWVIDAHGNPMVESDGCPNCGEGAGWIADAFAFLHDRPCSTSCRLQLEYAARRSSEVMWCRPGSARDVLDYISYIDMCVHLAGLCPGPWHEHAAVARGRQVVPV